MHIKDIIVGDDDRIVLTKLQAACFHFALFVTVCFVTIKTGEFNEAMWGMYAVIAVGHAAYDKTRSQNVSIATKKLDIVANSQLPPDQQVP